MGISEHILKANEKCGMEPRQSMITPQIRFGNKPSKWMQAPLDDGLARLQRSSGPGICCEGAVVEFLIVTVVLQCHNKCW